MKQAVVGGLLAFGLCMVVQVMAWRILNVRREMLGLALIYLIAPMLTGLAWMILQPEAVVEIGLAVVLQLSLACGYIQTYPALREDIPTFRILFALEYAAHTGLTAQELTMQLGGTDLYGRKWSDLQTDGLVCINTGGQLTLKPAGRALAAVFAAYRRLLGLQQGQG